MRKSSIAKYKKKFTAILLTTALTVSTVAAYPADVKAAGNEYVSDVVLYHGALSDAKRELSDYTFVEENLSEGSGGENDTYLGYMTTNDESLAIRDISFLQMNGSYHITDYNTLYQEKEAEYKKIAAGFRMAAEEFRANYHAGKQRAINAYETLNRYYDDDTRLKMGDFFLEEDESVVSEKQYITLLIEGNSTTVNTLQRVLATALDTEGEEDAEKEYGENPDIAGTTWVDRVAKMGGYQGLIEKENLERDTPLTKKTARKFFESEFADEVEELEEGWEALREGLLGYIKITQEDKISMDSDPDELQEYLDTLEEEDQEKLKTFMNYGALYQNLKDVPFGDGSLVDVFTQSLEEGEIDQDTMFVIVGSMSDAQRFMAPTLGMEVMVNSIGNQIAEEAEEDSILNLSEEDAEEASDILDSQHEEQIGLIDEIFEDMKEDEPKVIETFVKDDALSVYAGVDRDFFKGEIGMTGDGVKKQQSNNEPWYMSNGAKLSMIISGAIGATCIAAGTAILIMSRFTEYYQKVSQASQWIRECAREMAYTKNAMRFATNPKELAALHGNLQSSAAMSKYCKYKINKLQSASTSYGIMKMAGTALLVIGLVAVTYSLVTEVLRLLNKEKPAYLVIPGKMVENSAGEEGMNPYLFYKVVNDQNGIAADLNNYTSGTWLAMYTTKSYDAGDPILAKDFVTIKKGDIGTDTLNMHCAHEFGAKDPQNILQYSVNGSDAEPIYMFYRTAADNNTATTFGGDNATAGILVLVAGAAIVLGLFAVRRKKKGEAAA